MIISIKFSALIFIIGFVLTIGQEGTQQPDDIAAYGLNYTEPTNPDEPKTVPHIDSERFQQLGKRFEDTRKKIRREIANGLRADFPRIRSLVTHFSDDEGFVRQGIVFCGAETDHSKIPLEDLGDPEDPWVVKVPLNSPDGLGGDNIFPLPNQFGVDTGSLSLIDGWSLQNETYRLTLVPGDTGNTYTAASCTNGGDASSQTACEGAGNTYTAASCTNDGDASSQTACEKKSCDLRIRPSGNTYTPASCTNGGDVSSQGACENTGETYAAASCTNGGNVSSQGACENTGNTYTAASCTNGGDVSSQGACENTGETYTAASCTNGGDVSSQAACENTGETYTAASCTNGGNVSTQTACEKTGETYTAASCTNGGDASTQTACQEESFNPCIDKISIQCGLDNCLEGSFVSIVARFVRSHGYFIQHRDICSAFASDPPEIEARTCNLNVQPSPRKAFKCDRNASTNNLDWWQVNKQCYGIGKSDCNLKDTPKSQKCAWDDTERFCRANETYMENYSGDDAGLDCVEKEEETIPKSNYINEIWRVMGYSVNGEVERVSTSDKALITGCSLYQADQKTLCRTPRAFIHAINGNAQINAFRDLGIEEAAAAWFDEIAGVRSYLKALNKLLSNFYETSLKIFPFIENEEVKERCAMGEVEHDANTESGSKQQPLCQRLDYETLAKLNKVKEAGQSMVRSDCFCRNGNMDERFKEVNWATGVIYDGDLTHSPCKFVETQTGTKCKNNDGTENDKEDCAEYTVRITKCVDDSGNNQQCAAMDGTTPAKSPKDFLECQALSVGTGYNMYDVHEFDQIYLEVDPKAYDTDFGKSEIIDTFDYTNAKGETITRDMHNCLKFRNILPSVFTFCSQIRAWGDTETWNRILNRLKPDRNRIEMRKGRDETEEKILIDQIIEAIDDTLPPIENTCGRTITAYSKNGDKSLKTQISANKGGNCMPFEKIHEVIYRLEFETGQADNGVVNEDALVYAEQKATEVTDLVYSDMFCDEKYSYTNSKFSFRQMAYMWDHIQGGDPTDRSVSAGQNKLEYRPDGANGVPKDYFEYETTDGNYPTSQRYSMEDRSFCFIDWIGAFSGSTTRYDAFGSEYVDPYLLYSREIDEAVWNTAIAISSKKQVRIDNLELWDVLEDQLTNPEDGNILSSLAHAATAHYMTIQSTDPELDKDDYRPYFNQN